MIEAKTRTEGPPCLHCGEEMLPHPVKMFGASWRCLTKNGCRSAYRIDSSEKELYLRMVKERDTIEE